MLILILCNNSPNNVRLFCRFLCSCKVRDHNLSRLLFENGTATTVPQKKDLGDLLSITESKDTL